MEEILVYLSLKYNGNFEKIYRALQNKEEVKKEDAINRVKELKCQYTTIISEDYPKLLKQIECPPIVLYYYGDLSLLNNKTIGVIGMRKPSDYGIKVTDYLVKELVKNDYVIVSGLALGIDGKASSSAIVNGGRTVSILGSGIDYCYPKANLNLYNDIKKNQLLISEYPGNLLPAKYHFPARNRIIAGLSNSILVTEAKLKSGTMITVGYALEQGKDVMCVPSSIFLNDGCNCLIQQGAKLVKNVKDIIDN